MRAWIISDIHFSPIDLVRGRTPQIPKADICICAGDVSDNVAASIAYLRRNIEPHMPIVLVLGNHDYFGSSIDSALERARSLTSDTRIHLLENESVVIGGCNFIGATLWTDFAIPIGGDDDLTPEERKRIAFSLAPYRMADYHCIYRSDERLPEENGMLTVREVLLRHVASRKFIEAQLRSAEGEKAIVVTHHAPLVESLSSRFYGHVTNACFASDLSEMVTRYQPAAWIHGHIHSARDFIHEKTRILCNPLGYAHENASSGFRPNFIVDL